LAKLNSECACLRQAGNAHSGDAYRNCGHIPFISEVLDLNANCGIKFRMILSGKEEFDN
jgi:hypothetical protein